MRGLPRSVSLVRHDSFLTSTKYDMLRVDQTEHFTEFLREKSGGVDIDPALSCRVYVSCRATKENKRGKWQTRIFVLTAHWLFWFKDVPIARWRRPQNGVELRSVRSIALCASDGCFIITTVNDYEIRVDCGFSQQRAVLVYAIDVLARRCRGAASLREQGVETLVHEEGAPDVRASFVDQPHTRRVRGGDGGARRGGGALRSGARAFGSQRMERCNSACAPRRVVSPPGFSAEPPPAVRAAQRASSIAAALDAAEATAAALDLKARGAAARDASGAAPRLVCRIDALGFPQWVDAAQ